MNLIVDSNRLIAALIRDSASRELIFSGKFKFFTVGLGRKELEKYKQEILEKAQINEKELNTLLSMIFKKVKVISDWIIEEKFEEAKKIMDSIDPDDTPFIAASLGIENDGIWSDDKHFDKQNKVKIWKTRDLINYL